MKKALLFAFLALSINANAQNLHPESNNQYASSASIEKVLEKMKSGGEISIKNYPQKNFGETIKHQTALLLPPIQLFDSLYFWLWNTDTLINGWNILFRYIDFEYDASINLTSFIIQSWNDSLWGNPGRLSYTYDVNHNQTSELGQNWDGSEWVNDYQNIYTYDANNNQTKEINQGWDGSEWVNYYQNIYTYDANNNQTKEIDQSWNGSAWENSEQYLYTYNIHSKQTRQTYQYWDSGAWRNDDQYIYTYDAFNNRTSELGQDWDILNAIWVNTFKTTYTYDANNNQTSYTYQNWDGSAWVNVSRYTYTYDGNHNLTNAIYNSWDGIAWLISYQYQYMYTFDANQNLTNQLSQIWNGTSWVNNFLSINTYDSDNFAISQSHRYYSDSGTVEWYSDSTHYYFHTVTGINDLSTDDGNITVYPNPTSGKFTISSNSTLSAIEIYNLLGERIYSDHSNQQTSGEIDLSAQGKGIYLMNMYDGTRMYNRKIVVQ